MTSALSGIPIPRRRHLAAALGPFAALFVAVGAVAATGDKGATVRVFSAVALVVAATLALVAWGLLHSVKIDTAESQLDAAIEDVIAAGTDLSCDCGHEHDPNELHVSDTCAHDGSGAKCSHDCDSCVLAAMRPSPTPPRTERLTR